jgi:hypothetical protein
MELSHNNPISMRYDYKKRHSGIVNLKREERQRIQTTENPERIYFLWFLSLKLILEMEELGLGNRVIGKFKIDKEFYKDWDLEEVLNFTFYKWWKTHRELFETPSSVDIDNLKGWTPKPHFRFLRVDTRNNYTNIKKEVLKGIDNLKGQKVDKKSKYPVTGKPQYDNEILKYNIMVRKINEESNVRIFEKEKGRFKVIEQTDKSGEEYEKVGLDGKVKILRESKLFGIYRNYMSLSPEEREISTYKERRGIMDEREEEKYRLRMKRTLGLTIGRDLELILTKEINRLVKNYRQILCGVSQGHYRKPIKF